MLPSVALELLGCNQYSRPKTITFALDTLTLTVHPETHRSKKAVEDDLKQLIPVRRALMSIPTLKHCNIRSHAKPQDVPTLYFPQNEDIDRPHYQVGEHVWCQHGGWGFWPATVLAIEDTCLEILLCWGDMTQVTYAEVPSHVHPFMQNLAKYCVMSTNMQKGFHDGVEKALSEIVRSLPSHCVEDFGIRPRERFAARMLRIASVFERDIVRRNVRIAKEIEDEERKIVAEQKKKAKEEKDAEREILRVQKEIENEAKLKEKELRAQEKERLEEEKLQLKVYNALHFPPGSTIFAIPEKMKHLAVKKTVLPLKHMLRNLEEQSHIPPDRKRKRSVVKSYKDIRINDSTISSNGECVLSDSRTTVSDEPITSTTTLNAGKNKKNMSANYHSSGGGRDGKEEGLSLLEGVKLFHMNHVIQQQKCGTKSDHGVQIYASIYEMLMNGTYTDEESLTYCIENHLSSKLIKMLLYKYFPFDIYKGKNGRTLIHLAAQHDYFNVIAMLHEHWEKRFEVIHDHVINNVSQFAMVKDNHGRTAVHIACEFGSFKSLKVLRQLGCDLFERDRQGYSPLLWCATKDSPNCGLYLIDNGADVKDEDRKGRSTLWHAMASDSVLLGKTLLRNNCWMQGDGLQEFVADMSLGREPHKIMFDSRPLAECRAYYLNVEEEGERVNGLCSDVTISCRTRHHKASSPRTSPRRSSAPSPVVDALDNKDDDEEEGGSDRGGRSSSRVVQLSKEVSEDMLVVESSKWSLSDHMTDVCLHSPHLIPKFVYSTQSYLGEFQNDKISTTSKAYECCDCVGDCTLNPDCACIMRNGQRSPYSREGLFDFTKGKIFECGDKCSCKDSCKLRMAQSGVAYPLVVCRVGGKGHGVMTTKVIVKGSYVCAYVGERVSEDDLVEQEEEKMRTMKKKSSFVTYAFEIHEGSETFNVDSEYVGNVARFFNHSCDPNLRPIKVMAASKQKWPTMGFFALRRIEAGEELTWKYVTGVRTKKGGQACYCCSANCTGFV